MEPRFGPDALKAIGHAFDEAWAEIAGNFGNEPAVIESARLKLAEALLSVADDDSRDVEALKQAALQRMAVTTARFEAQTTDARPLLSKVCFPTSTARADALLDCR